MLTEITSMAQCAYCQAETEMSVAGDVPICIECSDAQGRRRKPATSESIIALLSEDLRIATLIAEETVIEFNEVVGEVPSGIPHPDGTQRLHNAADQMRMARNKMAKAHNRLDDYLRRGIVPEDLKRSG
jgi:predicted urease superfamily metal-dependent hydrolase